MIMSMSVWQRVGHLLLGWGCVGFVYSLTGHIYSSAHIISPIVIDDAIGYSPNSVWLYLSFFLFIPCGYLLSNADKVKPLMWQMILCAVLSGTVYLIYPTTAEFPQNIGSGLTQQALAGLLQVDTSQNMLPSLHVSLTLIAWRALCRKDQFLRNLLWLLWALMIIFSVLMLKRHLFIDVVGGAACAWIAITVVRLLTFRLLAANPSRRVR